LLLLVVVISGVILLLDPEIEQVTHPSLYDAASGPSQISPGEAFAVVHRELPEFEIAGGSAFENRGAWEVHSPSGEVARVDDTDGRLRAAAAAGDHRRRHLVDPPQARP
jgi:uncharacterized iron-regulated membrane protein